MRRDLIAAALVVASVSAWAISAPAPAPSPAPPHPGALELRGKFVGPDAASDAATFSALCDELAAVIEFDSMQPTPRLKTGASIEDLRVAAREARMKGVSLGARQPRVRDAVKEFLDEKAGVSGGPLTPSQRSAWAAAFREIGRAAADAAR
jgi:hypothetical protein